MHDFVHDFACVQCTYIYITNHLYTIEITTWIGSGRYLFNLNEVKNWLILAISIVGWCILFTFCYFGYYFCVLTFFNVKYLVVLEKCCIFVLEIRKIMFNNLKE